MTKKHQIRVGESDHKTNPKSKSRMLLNANQNKTWDQEFNSTNLLIPSDVLDKFKELYQRFSGKFLILMKIYNVLRSRIWRNILILLRIVI